MKDVNNATNDIHLGYLRNVDETTSSLAQPQVQELPAPDYNPVEIHNGKIFLAVESMKRHTADAGWQLTTGLDEAGYTLCGSDLTIDEQDVPTILGLTNPSIVIIQDKREWEGKTARQRGNEKLKFYRVEALKQRDDLFKLTVLKDAQQNPVYHKNSAEEMGVHGWITYYHEDIVKRIAPYIRKEHLVRTSHSLDPIHVPKFRTERRDCVVTGAVSRVYPLRNKIIKNHGQLGINYFRHPGYHAKGCMTPQFLMMLSKYKVSVCTSSMYGYALRKLIESSACGCVVVTDLPVDDRLPFIEDNLVRVSPNISLDDLKELLRSLCENYDIGKQKKISEDVKIYYDWRNVGKRLANDIETLRLNYGA